MIGRSVELRDPRVSVIIPAYNAEPFIRTAIQCVLDQTYPHVEVVVVDDGSTDGTAAAVQSFGLRVRYLHKANGGLASAWNTGIQQGAGEILAFLDADDVWLPGLVERQVEVLESRPGIDGVCVWSRFIDEHGQMLPDGMRTDFSGDLLRRLLLGGNSMLFSTVAVRRGVFDRVGLFDPTFRQAQDWNMMLRMAAAGIKFAAIPQFLVRRRVHPASISTDPERALYWDLLVLQQAFSTLPLTPNVRGLAPAANFWVLHRAALGNWRKGANRTAVGRLLEGFVTWPAAIHRPQTYLSTIRRLQPSGFRSDTEVFRNLDRLADQATRLLHEVLSHPDAPAAVQVNRRLAWGALHAALAVLNFQGRRWGKAAAHGVRSIVMHPVPALRAATTVAFRAARARGAE